MKRTVELSDTCLEAIEYIQASLTKGYFESTIPLLMDLVQGFYQMDLSWRNIGDRLIPSDIEEVSDRVCQAFDLVVTSYENNRKDTALQHLNRHLLPTYTEWKARIEKVYSPYLVS